MKIRLSDHFSYRKLISFTLPSIAMMIFTSIYGVVDGFFVSNFAGKTAFAAVNLVMPVLMIWGSVGLMLGTGGTALVALKCGEGDEKLANEYFSLITYAALAVGIFLTVIGLIFLRPLSILLGASGELLEYCVLYGRVFIISIPLYRCFKASSWLRKSPHWGFWLHYSPE